MINQIIEQRWCVDDFIAHNVALFPLLKSFRSTPQDPEWHAEGDVHIHTDMVLSVIYDLIESKKLILSEERSVILIYAALLHDYAKPICTREAEINGKIRTVAPRHEQEGLSRLFYSGMPKEFKSRRQWGEALALIAYHHIPKKLVLENAPLWKFQNLSRHVDIDLIYWLEYADMQGRECQDKEEQLLIMELFRESSPMNELSTSRREERINIINQLRESMPGINEVKAERVYLQSLYNRANGKIFMLEEEISRSYGYIDDQSHLVVMCGISGSGKSTYIKNNLHGYRVISLDSIRLRDFGSVSSQLNNKEVVRTATDELKQALRDKVDVVWDSTGLRFDFRDKVISLGMNYGAFTEIVLVQGDDAAIRTQNKGREHSVPDEVITSQLSSFQYPLLNEAHLITLYNKDI